MLKITQQIEVGRYTVLTLDGELPPDRKGIVRIEGKEYKTEIVYDLPQNIGVIGNGDFVGKEIEFI